jgi:hypothetical protein
VLRYEVRSGVADPEVAWALFARPARWSRWAPHLRGAWGLGEPEVEVGRTGAVRLLGAVPIPATITAKHDQDPDRRSWSWRVGGVVDMEHLVERDRDGTTGVAVVIRAPAPVEAALRVTYGPLVGALLGRLSRSATAPPRPTGTGTPAG